MQTEEAKDQEERDYQVDHSVVLYLVGPDGEFRQFFTQSVPSADVIEKVKGHMRADAEKAQKESGDS